jgi:hypothetical protein
MILTSAIEIGLHLLDPSVRPWVNTTCTIALSQLWLPTFDLSADGEQRVSERVCQQQMSHCSFATTAGNDSLHVCETLV